MRLFLTPHICPVVDPVDQAISFWRRFFGHDEPAKPGGTDRLKVTKLYIDVLEGKVDDVVYRNFPEIGVDLSIESPVVIKMICEYGDCCTCPPITKTIKLDPDGSFTEIEDND